MELKKQLSSLMQEIDEARKGAQEAREKAARLEGALTATILDAIGRNEKVKK